MSFPKFIAITSLCLFGLIFVMSMFKGDKKSSPQQTVALSATPIEIDLDQETRVEKMPLAAHKEFDQKAPANFIINTSMDGLPDVDRIDLLFNKIDPKFPIVETISYKSRVPWLKGRPAWVSDYASQYKTSRHFIARSLNGKPDYFKQNVGEGDRFNVFNNEKNFQFHLLIDLSRCKMWFYYYDIDSQERELIKTYSVGLGRLDENKKSGSLTPLGKYSLGEKIVIYKPKMFAFHNGEKIEMVKVFGSRWIPFEKELGECTAPARGFGIHGVPWVGNDSGELVPDSQSIGKYESDGCIRLCSDDIEELFSIIITKPTTVEIVNNFYDAKLPGIEK